MEKRKASGECIYRLCLNVSNSQYEDPFSVRVIVFTPPGVKGYTVLDAIILDIMKMETEGIIVKEPIEFHGELFST